MADDTPAHAAFDNVTPLPGGPPPPNEGWGQGRNEFGLPDNCPIKPLGLNGDTYFFLDERDQFRAITAHKVGNAHIRSMLGQQAHLKANIWPKLNDKGDPTGTWSTDQAIDDLMVACAQRGVIEPSDMLRGLGAWRTDSGRLILHCGDKIFCDGSWVGPGLLDDHIFPAAHPVPRPWGDPSDPGGTAARTVLEWLGHWTFQRGDLDTMLLLGWCAAAMVGGALHWRPMGWITGDKGTGKTTLMGLIGHLMTNAVKTSDASSASIAQIVGFGCPPIVFDEFEAEEDNRRHNAVLALMRKASSGDVMLRGTAEHAAVRFTLRSAMLFASINLHSLKAQDQSRLTVFALNPNPPDARPPDVTAQGARLVGQELQARMVTHWPRLDGLIGDWRGFLADRGFDGRAADQVGTLLACADLALFDAAQSPLVDFDVCQDGVEWLARLYPDEVLTTAGEASDAEACLAHLMQSAVDKWVGGELVTVEEMVFRRMANDEVMGTREQDAPLAKIGMKVTRRVENDNGKWWVYIARSHQQLAKIYAGTQWAARSGGSGGWARALARLPGAETGDHVKPRLLKGAGGIRCVRIPMEYHGGGDG